MLERLFPIIAELATFSLVGVIVSLDVIGLTLCQSASFDNEKRKVTTWAWYNALWHAGLLAVYLLAIYVGIGSPQWLEDALDYLQLLVPYINLSWMTGPLQLLAEHARGLFGLIAVALVWNIYSGKIISKPEHGSEGDLPFLAGFVYRVLRKLLMRSGESADARRRLEWHAQAAVVAVDMLALAALMKSSNYLEGFWRKFGLVLTVLCVVWLLALTAARWGRYQTGRVRDAIDALADEPLGERGRQLLIRTYNWLVVAIRLLEPLLIFYFLVGLVSFLIIGTRTHSPSFFLSAALLVVALLHRHGSGAHPVFSGLMLVYAKCADGWSEGDLPPVPNEAESAEADKPPVKETRKQKWVRRGFFAQRVGLLIAPVIVVEWVYFFWIKGALWSDLSPEAIISYSLGGVAFLLFLIDLVDAAGKRIVGAGDWHWEYRNFVRSACARIFQRAIVQYRTITFYFLATLLIAATAPIFGELMSMFAGGEANDDLSHENYVHAAQFAIWLSVPLVTCLFIALFHGDSLDGNKGQLPTKDLLATDLDLQKKKEQELSEHQVLDVFKQTVFTVSLIFIGAGVLQQKLRERYIMPNLERLDATDQAVESMRERDQLIWNPPLSKEKHR